MAFFLRLSILLEEHGRGIRSELTIGADVAAGKGNTTFLESVVKRVSGPHDLLL